jgi:hypothetical protein
VKKLLQCADHGVRRTCENGWAHFQSSRVPKDGKRLTEHGRVSPQRGERGGVLPAMVIINAAKTNMNDSPLLVRASCESASATSNSSSVLPFARILPVGQTVQPQWTRRRIEYAAQG